jgi:hypothetical protein
LREERRKQHAGFPSISIPSQGSFQQSVVPTNNLIAVVWDESRLRNLIRDGIEENLNLEYKSAPALNRQGRAIIEITKDISAFANSAGGVLIYGIAEFHEQARCHSPERIDPVDRTQFSKEWLEHIAAQIRPRIPDLKIYSVQLSTHANHVAYVLEIPQGGTAHQAVDHRYYRRYNFESVPMVDHEIRDILHRKTHPLILVGANIHVWPKPDNRGFCGRLIFDIHNESDVFARYLLLVAIVPIRISGKLVSYDDATVEETEGGTGYKLAYTNHAAAPLFPRMRLSPWFEFRFVNRTTPEPNKQLDHYQFIAFSDSMPVQSGMFTESAILRR